MAATVRLLITNFRIYKTFTQSFSSLLHNETKQILSYISLFAVNNALSFCMYVLILLGKNYTVFFLAEITYFLTGIFVIFYLAMIHIQNFKNSADELATTLDQTELIDDDVLDDSFENNFANLFLFGKASTRMTLSTNKISHGVDGE